MWLDDGPRLAYCGNVHPAGSVDELLANLRLHAGGVRAQICPREALGVGLHLPADVADALLGGRLDELRETLAAVGAEAVTLNGFPYADFQRGRIKAAVFAPDWRDPRRADYTLALARILHAVAPPGRSAGISTLPLSFAAWHRDAGAAARACLPGLLAVVEGLVGLERSTGRCIHVDLEPEPGGLLETSGDVVRFFAETLLPLGAPDLGARLGETPTVAERLLRRHLRVCYDSCHAAILFEEPSAYLRRLGAAGIGIGKLQASAALRCVLPSLPHARRLLADALGRFADERYLHQVVGVAGTGAATARGDLGDALEALAAVPDTEWRVHFHVPLYADAFGPLASTRRETGKALFELRRAAFTDVVEIETYTWQVLPDRYRVGLTESLSREFRWVLDQWAGHRAMRAA